MLVHELAEGDEVAAFQRSLGAEADVLYVVEIVDHGNVVLLGARILIAQQAGRGSCKTREEDQEIVGKRVARVLLKRKRLRFDCAVAAKREAGDAAERRDVLVLLADRLLEEVNLDMTGLLGELAWVNDVAGLRMQRAQQRGGKAAGRA